MANQTKPKHAVKSLLEAAKVVQGALVDDGHLPTDIRDDSNWLVGYLNWLADWHRRELADAQEHNCEDSWPRLYRAMLALAERDENGYKIVVSELADCHKCWNNLLRLASSCHTSDSISVWAVGTNLPTWWPRS
ncbi:hypothetical protein MSIMFB_03928 [Mycobacterium simulans]|uniref:Uncharacterized protein n=1 Tax=Mycobacterium simulans TaxID=627089 RepID=A0A7Z7IQ04_9MYCO|nr:hypothetical protein [Mycobacterium simulans]SOJ56452.1 hypothetical protein MSIMFB_03928 [Mycobacterium simulans]